MENMCTFIVHASAYKYKQNKARGELKAKEIASQRISRFSLFYIIIFWGLNENKNNKKKHK
jgi:hypothetical protein